MYFYLYCCEVCCGKGLVGGASPRAFRWSMIIKVRFTIKTNLSLQSLIKMRTITYVAGSTVTRFVSLAQVYVMDFLT